MKFAKRLPQLVIYLLFIPLRGVYLWWKPELSLGRNFILKPQMYSVRSKYYLYLCKFAYDLCLTPVSLSISQKELQTFLPEMATLFNVRYILPLDSEKQYYRKQLFKIIQQI